MAVGKKLRWEIFRRDNFACRYCGRSIHDGAVLEIDHVNPRARRGLDTPTNLVTACDDCNAGKSDTPLHAPPVEDVPQHLFRRVCAERGVTPPPVDDLDVDGLPAGLTNKILHIHAPEERDALIAEYAHWYCDGGIAEVDINDPAIRDQLAFRAFLEERGERIRLSRVLEQLVLLRPADEISRFDHEARAFVDGRSDDAPPAREGTVLVVAAERLTEHLNGQEFAALPEAEQAEWVEYAEALLGPPPFGQWFDDHYPLHRAAEAAVAVRAGRFHLSMCSFAGKHITACPRRAEHRIVLDDCEHCDGVVDTDGGHPACQWHLEAFRAGQMKRVSDGATASLRDVKPFSDEQRELA